MNQLSSEQTTALQDLISYFHTYIKKSKQPETLITKAFHEAVKRHKGQKRANGQDYVIGHLVPVAKHVIDLGMNETLVASALLHDTIEDTDLTYEEIKQNFNEEIASLVLGVSKLGGLKYRGNLRHVESLRRFFVASANDVRVVILKLADRWHNLETLHFLPAEKQKRIALESIMIHAPLASRLGMGKLVTIINDLAFPYAYPEQFEKTKLLREQRIKNAQKVIDKIFLELVKDLTDELGYTPQVDRRVKGLYSLYRKLNHRDWNIDDVFDIIAIRIICRNLSDCYRSLGIVHANWRPLLGRVKDYIAVPKPNGYQSIHTAIFTGDGNIVEVQIRTSEMHDFAEYGVASHHSYKTQQLNQVSSETFHWINQLKDLNISEKDPNEYLKELRTDFFSDRIFCFTPKGDVIDLPAGATLLDFAFMVHTELGTGARGGKINGKFCALKTKLRSGDIVEISSDPKRTKPNIKWLEWSVTNQAHSKIRRLLGISKPNN